VLVTGILLASLSMLAAAAGTGPAFVGRQVCAECHADQNRLWQGSHHDLAMQVASEQTVLGDFDNATFTNFGVTSRFFRHGDSYRVQTDGPDGKLHDYEVKYTFGVTPLQQYLIEFPGGRLQALSVAWDSRPEAEGGQRWFHLYPDEKIAHDDELHWTAISQNWNSRCAECHSTHLQKNYDPQSRTFNTRWSEIDVSCEACHGPGSEHIAWARRKPAQQAGDKNRGLTLLLDEREGVSWRIAPGSDHAQRSKARDTDHEIEMCARCHSRRSPISKNYIHGEPLLDHYLPSLLEEGMYFADGQIQDEVYVYGSFIQSRMYHAGVTCSDCHEPHSLKLRKPGNGVCLQCHLAAKYDRIGHHHHKSDTAGARCAECHMPTRTYMGVDVRRDHSLRIPRPDLSDRLGTPNACLHCHKNQDTVWAVQQTERWYGHQPVGFQRFAGALAAARNGEPSAGTALQHLVQDTATPDIARATAIAALGEYLTPEALAVFQMALTDRNALVRASAAGARRPGIRATGHRRSTIVSPAQ